MKQYPEAIAGAFILNPQNNIFLMKSHKWSDHYVVPGGHIEFGETIVHALQREIQEETGLTIFDEKFLCLWEYIEEKEFLQKKHMIFLNYLAHTTSHVVTLNTEAQSFVWVTPKQALQLPLEKYTRLTIENYIVNPN